VIPKAGKQLDCHKNTLLDTIPKVVNKSLRNIAKQADWASPRLPHRAALL
jgi:hypothetical protein